MTIQNIPQGAGWFGALNSNFSYTKQQLDNLGFKNAGQVITYLNGFRRSLVIFSTHKSHQTSSYVC